MLHRIQALTFENIGNMFLTELRLLYSHLTASLRKKMILMAFLSVLTALTELAVAGSVSLLGLIMATPESVKRLSPVVWASETFSVVQDVTASLNSMVLFSLALIVVAVCCKTLSFSITTFLQQYVAEKISLHIGRRLFHNLLWQPYSWYLEQNTAVLQAELGWRGAVGPFLYNALSLCINSCIVILLLVSALILSPIASILVFAVTGLVAVFSIRCFRKKIHAYSKNVSSIDTESAKVSLTALQGIHEIRIYNQQRAFQHHFDDELKMRPKLQSLAYVFSTFPQFLLEFCGMLMLLISYVVLVLLGTSQGNLILALSLLAGVAWRVLPAFNRIIASYGAMQVARPYINTVCDNLSMATENSDDECEPFLFSEDIAVNNVSFSYPKTAEMALEDISFKINKGEMIGVVGRSGAGKSTLVGLLTGLYSVDSGTLTVDGREITSENVSSWTKNIGYVPQSIYLLDATLAENIAFSEYGKPIDRERIYECCQLASIDFLDSLEHGIDTQLGERGVRLSGGQAQRIAIARALYRHPKVIIFDEATSALDGKSEEAIQQTILSLRDSITLFVIAHRLSTVEPCDRILWLEDGAVKMEGNPHEVLLGYAK